jgi:hypothetical protein
MGARITNIGLYLLHSSFLTAGDGSAHSSSQRKQEDGVVRAVSRVSRTPRGTLHTALLMHTSTMRARQPVEGCVCVGGGGGKSARKQRCGEARYGRVENKIGGGGVGAVGGGRWVRKTVWRGTEASNNWLPGTQ